MEDRRNVGESSYNSGDGRDQRVQALMFMMMMMIIILKFVERNLPCSLEIIILKLIKWK